MVERLIETSKRDTLIDNPNQIIGFLPAAKITSNRDDDSDKHNNEESYHCCSIFVDKLFT